MSILFTNWQTTLTGIATIVATVMHMFGISVPAELSTVLAGIGLVLAKDGFGMTPPVK